MVYKLTRFCFKKNSRLLAVVVLAYLSFYLLFFKYFYPIPSDSTEGSAADNPCHVDPEELPHVSLHDFSPQFLQNIQNNHNVEARFRARNHSAVMIFAHVHKAGGTTICEAAIANGEGTMPERSSNCGHRNMHLSDLMQQTFIFDKFNIVDMTFGAIEDPMRTFPVNFLDNEQR